MTLSLVGACLWVVLAFVMQVIPSNDNHWRRAYVLIGIGIPLLIWIVSQNGLVVGLLVFLTGASVLRWPLIFFMRWIRTKVVGQ